MKQSYYLIDLSSVNILSKLSFSSFTNALAVLISVSTLLSTIFFPIKLLFTLSNALAANLKVVRFDTLAIVLPTPVSANLEAAPVASFPNTPKPQDVDVAYFFII